jgi:uncharacterized protein
MSNNQRPQLPESVQRLAEGDSFCFACHPGVKCFTECCRLLELPLTPYDVLRLRRGTGLSSSALHERYIIEEKPEEYIFPKYYLTMVDDGRASCAFVGKDGCSVYEHRPGACRAYPLGRAAMRACGNRIVEYHVLLKEDHCQGFNEAFSQNASEYSRDQGLLTYNEFNDKLAPLVQHSEIRKGLFRPDKEQIRLYRLALYDIDTFRRELQTKNPALGTSPDVVPENDEDLLLFGIDLLVNTFFANNEKE